MATRIAKLTAAVNSNVEAFLESYRALGRKDIEGKGAMEECFATFAKHTAEGVSITAEDAAKAYASGAKMDETYVDNEGKTKLTPAFSNIKSKLSLFSDKAIAKRYGEMAKAVDTALKGVPVRKFTGKDRGECIATVARKIRDGKLTKLGKDEVLAAVKRGTSTATDGGKPDHAKQIKAVLAVVVDKPTAAQTKALNALLKAYGLSA